MEQQTTRFLRQLDICPPEKLSFPITVIGAGAVGSFTVLALAKMGCSDITVWDDDLLEEHNVSNQACKPSLLGQLKVEALRELVDELCDPQIALDCRRYKGQALKGLVITVVDSMDVRLMVWRRVKLNPAVPLLIDPRMGAEFARLYSISPSNVEHMGTSTSLTSTALAKQSPSPAAPGASSTARWSWPASSRSRSRPTRWARRRPGRSSSTCRPWRSERPRKSISNPLKKEVAGNAKT